MLAVKTDKDRRFLLRTPQAHTHTVTYTHSIKDPGLCLTLRAQQGRFFYFLSEDQIGAKEGADEAPFDMA